MSHHYYSYYNHDASQCDIEIVECANCQIAEPAQLAALREAGEKMRAALEYIQEVEDLWGKSFDKSTAALEAWKAANK